MDEGTVNYAFVFVFFCGARTTQPNIRVLDEQRQTAIPLCANCMTASVLVVSSRSHSLNVLPLSDVSSLIPLLYLRGSFRRCGSGFCPIWSAKCCMSHRVHEILSWRGARFYNHWLSPSPSGEFILPFTLSCVYSWKSFQVPVTVATQTMTLNLSRMQFDSQLTAADIHRGATSERSAPKVLSEDIRDKLRFFMLPTKRLYSSFGYVPLLFFPLQCSMEPDLSKCLPALCSTAVRSKCLVSRLQAIPHIDLKVKVLMFHKPGKSTPTCRLSYNTSCVWTDVVFVIASTGKDLRCATSFCSCKTRNLITFC